MADGGYQVTTSELHDQVAAVRKVAGTLRQASDAAQQVTVGVQAYGMICGPLFVPIVLAVSAPGLITLGLAAQSVDSVADELQKTAEHYDAIDQSNADNLAKIAGRLS